MLFDRLIELASPIDTIFARCEKKERPRSLAKAITERLVKRQQELAEKGFASEVTTAFCHEQAVLVA